MPSSPPEAPDDHSLSVQYRRGANRFRIGTATFAAITLLQLTCTSCATYTPRSIDAGEVATALEQRSLDQQDVRDLAAMNGVDVSEWPPDSWSPELLTVAALALSPSLDVARAEWDVVRASISTAGEIPNPSLVAGLEHKNGSGLLSPRVSSIAVREHPASRSDAQNEARSVSPWTRVRLRSSESRKGRQNLKAL